MGAGAFGYSINDATVSLPVTGGLVDDNSNTIITALRGTTAGGTASFELLQASDSASVNFDIEFINTIGIANVDVIRVPTSSFTDPDLEAVRGFVVNDGSLTNYPQFNSFTAGTSYVDLFVANGTADKAVLTISYLKGPDNLNDRGDFEDADLPGTNTTNSSLDIPEINVQFLIC